MSSSFYEDLFNVPEKPKRKEVPPEGDPSSRIMIIGESPGSVELMKGIPFVGPAGKLLDSKLAAAGIHRSRCYITNAVKRQMSPREVDALIKWITQKKVVKGMDMLIAEWHSYEKQLQGEIENSSANVIIALGGLALAATTGLTNIMKRRGSVFPCILDPRKKVIAVIHPAACTREYKLGHLLHFDLTRAAEEARTPHITPSDLDIITEPTLEESLRIIQMCREVGRCAFDLEVLGEEISCFSLAWAPTKAVSIALVDARGYPLFTEDEEIILFRALRDLLEDPTVKIIGQNIIGFDCPYMLSKYGIVTKNIDDTMVGQAILWPDFPKGLDFITSIYTRYPYYKDDGKKYMKIGGDLQAFWEYNAKDAIICFQAMPKILDALHAMNNMRTYERVMSMYEPLLFINYHGQRISPELLEVDETGERVLVRKALQDIDRLKKELNEVAGMPINPASPKSVMNFFYTTKGVKPYTKNGQPSSDVNALKRLKAQGFREADILLELRKKNKIVSSYLNMKFDADGRLRSAMNPTAETGRLKTSKTIFGTGGNIQNLPPSFKKYIIADDGHLLFNMDLSQAENRLVALFGSELRMLEAFEKGIDIHSLTASLIFQQRYPELTPERIKELNKELEDWPKSAGPPPSHLFAPIGNGQRPWRYWGKQSNHALNYKLGPQKFALHLEIPLRDAEFIRNRYYAVYPGVEEYQNMVANELRQNGMKITNIFGRTRRFMERWGDEVIRQACAFLPQSTVADKINEHGVIPAYEMPYLMLMNQVHDSIQFQLPLSIGFDAIAMIIQQVKENLETPVEWKGRSMVIPADTKMGLGLGTMLDVKPTPESIENAYRSLIDGKAGR